MKGEELASGSPHADNVAPVLLGGFTLVRCSKSIDIIGLPSPSELYTTVLHPKIELKTVQKLAKNYFIKKIISYHGRPSKQTPFCRIINISLHPDPSG